MNCGIASRWIVLDLYGELDARDEASLQEHLAGCRACAEFLSETKRALALIDEHAPAHAPAVDAEAVWKRIRGGLAAAPRPAPRYAAGWRWGFAGAALVFALIAGIFLGRSWFSPAPAPPRALVADAGPSIDQALSVHLEDAAPVLIDHLHRIENGKGRTVPVEESAVRALLLQNLILRQALVETNPAAAELLDDLDLVFKEIVSGGTNAASIRDLIRERNILFRLRILKPNKEIIS